MERHLEDRSLSIFSNDDKVTIMAHANAQGADAVDYLQQCEEHIRILLQSDESDLDMLNTVEKMLSELPEPRKTARGSMDFSSEAVARVGTQLDLRGDNVAASTDSRDFGLVPSRDVAYIVLTASRRPGTLPR